MYMYIHIYTFTCICIHIYIYICMYKHMYIYIYILISVCDVMFCTLRLDTYVDVHVCIYVYKLIYIYTYLICIWYWLIQFVIWHHLYEMRVFWVRDVTSTHLYIPSFIRWLIAFVIVHFAYMILAWLVYMSCLHDSFVRDILNDAWHTETAAPMTAHWDRSIGIDSSYMKLT